MTTDADLQPMECPACGTALEFEFEDGREARPAERAATGAGVVLPLVTRCPNPDCPASESDLAPAADQ